MTKEICLTDKGLLEVFSFRYYQGHVWEPKEGDYYVIGRNSPPHRLCQITTILGGTIFTRMLPFPEISDWPSSEFTKGFGVNRMYVPDYIFEYEEFIKELEEKG